MEAAPACVFCQIAAQEEAASVVYDDGAIVAFLDHDPLNPGHTLVIPRRHAPDLAGLEPGEAARLPVAQQVAAAIRGCGLHCEGILLQLSDGAPAGQDVFHVHLHIIPRWPGDGLYRRNAERGAYLPPRSELDVIAAHIRRCL